MGSADECVSNLAKLAGVKAVARREYNWEAIENFIGTRLPSDYKVISESFPKGLFRMFAEVWGPHGKDVLLSETSSSVLEAFREMKDDGEIDIPYPFFPDAGGLLIAGYLRSPGYIFWATEPRDPDEWRLVLADEECKHWEPFNGSLCEFLTSVTLGKFDAGKFRDAFKWNGQTRIDINSRPVFGNDLSRPN